MIEIRYENQIMRLIYISFIILFFLLLALIINNGTGNLVNMAWGLYVALIVISPVIIISLSKQMQKKQLWKFSFLAITIIMFILSVVIMIIANPNITLPLQIYGGLFIGLILIANIFIYYYKTKSTPNEILQIAADKKAAIEKLRLEQERAIDENYLKRHPEAATPSAPESVSPPSYTDDSKSVINA
jgi:Na+/proline symporter